MNLIRRSRRPGNADDGDPRSPVGITFELRRARVRPLRENASARAVRGSLTSFAARTGSQLLDSAGKPARRLRDVVEHWTPASAYPPDVALAASDGERHHPRTSEVEAASRSHRGSP